MITYHLHSVGCTGQRYSTTAGDPARSPQGEHSSSMLLYCCHYAVAILVAGLMQCVVNYSPLLDCLKVNFTCDVVHGIINSAGAIRSVFN